MSVVKVIELLSESPESWEDAARQAVERASRTLKNIRSIYVKEMTAAVEGGEIVSYRVNVMLTFALSEGEIDEED